MSLDVYLIAKTLDDDKKANIFQCFNEKDAHFLSKHFSLFIQRDHEGSEFEQIQQQLDIDLGLMRSYPVNAIPEPGKLDYELYLAEKNQDETAIALAQQKIVDFKKKWRKEYNNVNEGWVRIGEMEKLLNELFEKVQTLGDTPLKMLTPEEWEYEWGNYFTGKKGSSKYFPTFRDDINTVLKNLECMKKEEIEYVAFFNF